jgi:hypothetical protein
MNAVSILAIGRQAVHIACETDTKRGQSPPENGLLESGMIAAVLMIHTPLAGDSISTCFTENALPSEICPLAPTDLTIGSSEIWFAMSTSNHAFMLSCRMIFGTICWLQYYLK